MAKKRAARGRPRKPAGTGKSLLMQVRVSVLEKQVFSEVAEMLGEQLSVWVRQTLRRVAQAEMTGRGKPDPFSASKNAE